MKKEQIYVVIDDEPKRLRAIQILTDAGEKIFECDSIFNELFRGTTSFLGTTDFESTWGHYGTFGKQKITLDQLEQLLNPNFVVKEVVLSIEELQKQAENLGFDLVKKERQIKVGDFGKFWDDLESECFYGFLLSINQIETPFRIKAGTSFRNFSHLTDEEKKQIQENW